MALTEDALVITGAGHMRFACIAVSAALVSGCQFRPTPVPVVGDRTSIVSLAGMWTGTYQGTTSGRSGSITFTIRVDVDSAFGDVMMHSPAGIPVVRPADDPSAHRVHARGPQLLAIRFVGIVGGEIEGALEPYVAPDCDCTVRTVFTGLVRGDTVRGTFITGGEMLTPQTGVWVITRGSSQEKP